MYASVGLTRCGHRSIHSKIDMMMHGLGDHVEVISLSTNYSGGLIKFVGPYYVILS